MRISRISIVNIYKRLYCRKVPIDSGNVPPKDLDKIEEPVGAVNVHSDECDKFQERALKQVVIEKEQDANFRSGLSKNCKILFSGSENKTVSIKYDPSIRLGPMASGKGNSSLLDLENPSLRNNYLCEDHFDGSSFMNATKSKLTSKALPKISIKAPSTSRGFSSRLRLRDGAYSSSPLPKVMTPKKSKKKKVQTLPAIEATTFMSKESFSASSFQEEAFFSGQLKVTTPKKIYNKSIQASGNSDSEISEVNIMPNKEFLDTFVTQAVTPVRSKRKFTLDVNTPRKKILKTEEA